MEEIQKKSLPFKAERVLNIILGRQTIKETCCYVDSLEGQILFVDLMAIELGLKIIGEFRMSNNDFESCVCLTERK